MPSRFMHTLRAPSMFSLVALVLLPVSVASARPAAGGDTPRDAMRGYLEACRAGAYAQAADFLDLSRLPAASRGERGPDLARELKTILDRTLWVDLDGLSDAAEGDLEDGLPPGRDRVGTIETADGPVPIDLAQVGRGKPTWRISAETVALVPALRDEFGDAPLRAYLPPVFFEIRLFEVQLWQWTGLSLLLLLALLLAWATAAIAVRIARPLVARSGIAAGERLTGEMVGPLRLFIAAALFAAGSYFLALSVPAQTFLASLQKTLVVVAFAWAMMRVVDLAAATAAQRLQARGQAVGSVVPLGRRAGKIVVAVLAALVVSQNLGLDVTGLLAGLGLGGLALALAAQKTVENLFGGVTLITDQPVRVGDFCRFGECLGTVEDVGLRSTRIRTLDRTLVTVPNGEFSAMQIENFAKRDRIRLFARIGLRYETTPDQLRWVLIELKKLLVAHPKVLPDPARVRFVSLGAYSLDLEIFAYVATSDINEFLAIQEEILLRIMDLVAASGTGFAFPSQTVYTGQDLGLDAERSRVAEAQVRRLREENTRALDDGNSS